MTRYGYFLSSEENSPPGGPADGLWRVSLEAINSRVLSAADADEAKGPFERMLGS